MNKKFIFRGLQLENKLLYLTSLKQKNKKQEKFFIYNIKVKKMTKFVVNTHDFDTRRDGRGFGKHDKDRHRHRVI